MKNRPSNLRTRVLGTLASILAIGALAPHGANSPAQQAAQQRAELQQAGSSSAKNAANVTASNAPGAALAQLIDSGGGASFHSGGGRPPKVWGMSRWCANMVASNRRKGRTGRKGR